jgi:hypothetical protein
MPSRALRSYLPCLPLALACLVSACRGNAGPIYSPPDLGNPTNAPAISIYAPSNGAQFHAHDDIPLIVLVTPHGTSLGPDADATKKYSDESKWHFLRDNRGGVAVGCLAGTNIIGSGTSAMVSASMRSQHGEAVPMIAMLVGYPAVQLTWHAAAPGAYALTARATNAEGLVTVSSPVNITVLP